VVGGASMTIARFRAQQATLMEERVVNGLLATYRPLLLKLLEETLPVSEADGAVTFQGLMSKELLDVVKPEKMKQAFTTLQQYGFLAIFKIGKDIYYAITPKAKAKLESEPDDGRDTQRRNP
jgi:hypothetical protein